MDIVELARQRYTAKHYDSSKKIPAEDIDKLCSVLQNTPSSVNSQPWHFIIVQSDEGKRKIREAIADFNHSRTDDASHIVIFCAKTAFSEADFQRLLEQEKQDGRYQSRPEIANDVDQGRRYFVGLNSKTQQDLVNWESKQIYIALGNLLLAATALGIDSTAIEGFDSAKLDQILDLPSRSLTSVVLASLGYRSEKDSNATRPKSRLPREELFTFL